MSNRNNNSTEIEKKGYTEPQPYYYQEDEISLRELIQGLIDGKKIIALFLIIAILLSGIGSLIAKTASREAKIIIALNFKGIDEGLNPDGSKFDVNYIKSPEVIMPVINALELDEKKVTVNDIRKNMSVDPIVPSHIVEMIKKQREQGKDYTFFPNEFVITLKAKGVKEGSATQILDGIVDSYANKFNEKYSEEAVLANTVKNINYDEYDYPEISRIVNNQLSLMKSYLEARIIEAPDFRSATTGMTFMDISKSLDLIDSVELNRMDSLIGAFNLTKDMNKLIINYEYRIKRDELDRQKKESEQSISKDMIQNYKREENMLLIPGMGTTDTEGKTNTSEDKYYDKLVERATDAGVGASNKAHDIQYFLNEIKGLREDQVNPDTKKQVEQDVLELAKIINTKINSWIEVIEKTSADYYEVKFSKAVMKLSPAEIYSDINVKMNVAIGAIIGLMLGIFVVLFKKYWRDSEPVSDKS